MTAAARLPNARLRLAALTLAGAAHALAFAPGPLPAWSLAIVQVLALAVLAWHARQARRPRGAFVQAWWFSTVSFSIGLYWLFVSMHLYGGLGAALSTAGVLALSAFLALFPAAACALALWLAPAGDSPRRAPPWLGMLVWAAAWTFAEWLRATVLTGFPWLNIGYAHVDGPIAGWAPVLGVHGMAFVAACAAYALAGLPFPRAAASSAPARGAWLAAAAALALALTGWPLAALNWSHPQGSPLHVRLVQGNIEQSQKFDPTLTREGLERHFDLAARPPAAGEPAPDLIVLPETVLPVFQDQLDPAIWQVWVDIARRQNAVIIMGVPLHTGGLQSPSRYTNSAIRFDGNTSAQQISDGVGLPRYDKRHLVPWGEYVPPGFRWFVDMLAIPLGDFDRGDERQQPFTVGDQHLAMNICYEDLFGPEMLPALRAGSDGQPGATLLINLSNLGWFGDTWALRQHLQIGRLRTMELARPMLTSTNTGITAAIDARGRVQASLPTHAPGVLAVEAQGTSGLTPYARFGDLPVVLIVLLILAAGLLRASRKAR
jgi:apolipoprotein N-acyltransferase